VSAKTLEVPASSVGVDGGPQMKLLKAELLFPKLYVRDFKWRRDSLNPRKWVLVSPLAGTLRLILDSAGAEMGAPDVIRVPRRGPVQR
jgi:hypothetical protein